MHDFHDVRPSTIFIRKDVFKAAEKIHELLIEDRDELAVSQSKWLSDTVDRTVQNIDAILLMLYQQKDLHEKLKFSSSELDVWTSAARLLGFDPEIDLIQVHDLKQNKSAVITPHAATLYSVMVTPQRSGQMGFTLMSLKKSRGGSITVSLFLKIIKPKRESPSMLSLIQNTSL